MLTRKRLQALQLSSGLGSRHSKLLASGVEILNEWDEETSSDFVEIIMITCSTHGAYANNSHPRIFITSLHACSEAP